MSSQRVLDVSALPVSIADSRALIWWGNLGMMVIEGSMFAMTLATFLYFRVSNLDWPPATVPRPDLTWPTVNFILLILSAIPAFLADRAAQHNSMTGIRIGLGLCIVVGFVFLAIRTYNMINIGFKWSDHAYGSIVWTVVGLHTFHTISATGENSLLFGYLLTHPATKKRLLDVRCGVVYWYFLVISWIPFYFLIYIQPWWRRKGM